MPCESTAAARILHTQLVAGHGDQTVAVAALAPEVIVQPTYE